EPGSSSPAMQSPGPVRRVLFSQSDGRLRLFWRLGLHGALSISLITLLTLPVILGGLVSGAQPPDFLPSTSSPLWSLALLLPGALAMTISTWIARRFLDRRPFATLGLVWNHDALPDLVVGFAIALLMMGAVFAMELAAGWVRIEGFAWSALAAGTVATLTAAALLQFIIAGYQEEIFSRGYHLQNFGESYGPAAGVLASAAIFGLLHAANPGAGWGSTLGIFAAGAFFGFAYLRTQRLWLPIGLHAGWNFFEGTVFGFPVSGLGFFRLVEQAVGGPELVTGGSFGPEAGLIVLPALALGTYLVWVYTHNRKALATDAPTLPPA
ncbi:MAG: lysostaphin resistance A-like protein, partial [Anaerolineales bacterium]